MSFSAGLSGLGQLIGTQQDLTMATLQGQQAKLSASNAATNALSPKQALNQDTFTFSQLSPEEKNNFFYNIQQTGLLSKLYNKLTKFFTDMQKEAINLISP